MVAENKNANEMTSGETDESTSELEVISIDIHAENAAEMDADTFSLDDSEAVGDIATLSSDLKSRDERIASLQFDIEQLRSRWGGLEKEIAAREELTDMLRADLKTAHKTVAARDKQITKLERKLESSDERLDKAKSEASRSADDHKALEKSLEGLREDLSHRDEQIQSLTAQLENAEQEERIAQKEELIAELRVRIQDLDAHIDGRNAQWLDQDEKLRIAEDALQSTTIELDERNEDLRQQRDTNSRLEQQKTDAEDALRSTKEELSVTRSSLKSKTNELDQFQTKKIAILERQTAEQAGQLADQKQEIERLTARTEQAERYADELRHRMEELDSSEHSQSQVIEDLRGEIAEKQTAITALQADEQSATERTQELDSEVAELKAQLADGQAGLKQQLLEAEAALAEHEAINEQLTSDLIENRAFKQALEDQLTAASAEHGEAEKKLRRANRKLEQEINELNDKISSKDSAISALLSELANNSRALDSIGEIENVIHEIDHRMSEKIDDGTLEPERDRPTRLLVGKVDDQELRFPLFKDRLTIGRTSQNDIQLRAQYVSRRHAVLVAEDDGTHVVDWGSKNGVFVNGARVMEHVLKSGDTVSIGNADFRYEELSKRSSTAE